MGVVDYSMTQMHNPAYMAQFTPEQVAYFTNQPAWFVGFWALAVWSALLGSVLLLMRRRAAVIVFALSLAAMVVTMFHTYVLSAVPFSSVAGPEAKWFSSAIFLAAMGLWFLRALDAKGAGPALTACHRTAQDASAVAAKLV